MVHYFTTMVKSALMMFAKRKKSRDKKGRHEKFERNFEIPPYQRKDQNGQI